jgi:N-acetylglucosaminyldiphosphoundecaprenol N-acetyl-beta-D-mannosaminyltransferase
MRDKINYVETLGYRVFSDALHKIQIEDIKCRVINTISPNSYGLATKDSEFDKALRKTDYLVLDGVYFAFASILLNGKNIKANQGPDVFNHFMSRGSAEKSKVFFLGSTQETLKKIKERTKSEYPNFVIETYSPPFKPEFSNEDNQKMLNEINKFKPDILFVGMTCPKQEKWAIKHRELLNTSLIICIGNVFDWYAGTQKPVHPFWYRIKLGWLIRIFIRPEIFRRNIGNQMKFFWHVILIFLKLKKYDQRINHRPW